MTGRFNLDDYIDVQQRITRFWEENPNGAIRTNLASDVADFCTCRYRAEVYKDAANAYPDATGYAFEIAGSGMANKTSHEENCETSAIGRALANMGYATSNKDRPSKQEMTKAANGAEERPKRAASASKEEAKGNQVNEAAMKRIHAILGENGLEHKHLHAYALAHGHKSSSDMSMDEMKRLADGLKEKTDVAVQYLQKLSDDFELRQAGDELSAALDAKGGK